MMPSKKGHSNMQPQGPVHDELVMALRTLEAMLMAATLMALSFSLPDASGVSVNKKHCEHLHRRSKTA